MNLKQLKEVIETLKDLSDNESKMYGLGLDMIEYVNPYHNLINTLLDSIYTEESCEMFYWFCYEKDFGRKKDLGAWDENGKEICQEIEGLHKHLKLLK